MRQLRQCRLLALESLVDPVGLLNQLVLESLVVLLVLLHQ
ncbi:hypothetical protein ATPR_2697 [Acetobacter tropicalis NBRC 101654]|uniref:Uncharacterized protein n=1 Tax=Acetobacter tropicalis NBRC 101654 TaxID=749388 RepID=F7VH48_9PROT|nr:hypothetical protein ATPR_2697 [Acetobacter tropicalis NBRC 101654]